MNNFNNIINKIKDNLSIDEIQYLINFELSDEFVINAIVEYVIEILSEKRITLDSLIKQIQNKYPYFDEESIRSAMYSMDEVIITTKSRSRVSLIYKIDLSKYGIYYSDYFDYNNLDSSFFFFKKDHVLIANTPNIELIHDVLYVGGRPCHMDGGPAIINYDVKEYHQYGKPHRIGGPAVEHSFGTKEYYENGERHREDGPAVEHYDGSHPVSIEYWLCGKKFKTKRDMIHYRDYLMIME